MNKTIKKSIILFFILLIFTIFLTACKENDYEYEIGNEYFRKPTFTTYTSQVANFVGNIGVITDNYNIEIKCKCLLPLYEYTLTIDILNNKNEVLNKFEQTRSKEIEANTEFIENFELSYNEYKEISNIKTEFKGKTKTNPNTLPEIKIPIKNIYFNNPVIAIEIGKEINLDIQKDPIDTDEDITLKSSNENIIIIEKNKIKAIAEGEAFITAASKNGKTCYKNIKVLPKFNSDIYQNLKNQFDKAIITIENFSYDKNAFGNYVGSTTIRYTGVIFKQVNNRYYFITAAQSLKKYANYSYNTLTAKNYKNESNYRITIVKEENDITPGNDYKMAIGYIEGYNIGSAIQFNNRNAYYKDERIFIKDGSNYQYGTINDYSTNLNNDFYYPIKTACIHKNILMGTPIFDNNLKLIGIGIKGDTQNYLNFITANKINDFIKSCGL